MSDTSDSRRRRARAVVARRALGGVLGFFVTAALWPASARAHDLSRSESRIEIQGSSVRVQLVLDLLEIPGVDVDGDARVSYEELDEAIGRVFDAIKTHFEIRAPEQATRVVLERYDIIDEHVARLDLHYAFRRSVARVEVVSTLDLLTSATHQHLARAVVDGGMQWSMLDRANRTATFVDDRLPTGWRIAIGFGLLGVVGRLGFWLLRRRERERGETPGRREEVVPVAPEA